CVALHEPTLHPVAIADLRPTQITVGMHEVDLKREHWRELTAAKGADFLGRHMIPTVIGPKKRHYLTDNHHLARAMWDEGVTEVLVTVQVDLSALSKVSFWRYLDNRALCHPYNDDGVRVHFDEIPGAIAKLVDDPYRSLAGSLRHVGGYSKDMTPFSEFLWADFLRSRIKRRAVEKDFDDSLKKALKLAKSDDAAYLPGWCGVDPIV
ncbi:MAG: ParB-like protein, partial [Caulobacteraceae bacterium]